MIGKEIRDIFTDIGIVVVVLLLVLPFTCSRGDEPVNVSSRDTVYIHDTIRIVEPTPTKEEVVGEEVAKLPKAKSELKDELKSELNIPISTELDSIGELPNGLSNGLSNDSAEVIIPITERTYEDSTYKAIVRGYNPELVSLDIYQSTITKTITKTKNPKITVSAGVYGGFGSKGADYGLGIMVGVPIWSW